LWRKILNLQEYSIRQIGNYSTDKCWSCQGTMVANVVSDQDGIFGVVYKCKLNFLSSLSMKREEWETKKRHASQNTSAAACIRCEGQNNKKEITNKIRCQETFCSVFVFFVLFF